MAVIKEGEKWRNALTVIRFSYINIGDLQEKYKALRNKLGNNETPSFKIICKGLKIDEWDNVLRQFSAGKIKLNDVEVELGEEIDLNSMECCDSISFLRKIEDFKLLEGIYTAKTDMRRILDELNNKVKSYLGFDDIYIGISQWLELSYSHNTSLYVVICAPVYAAISNIDFEREKTKVNIKFHKNMSDLRTDISLWEGKRKSKIIKKLHLFPIDPNEAEDLGEFKRYTLDTILPTAMPDDDIDVVLVNTKLPEVNFDYYEGSISKLLSKKELAKNPLFVTFNLFCNEEEFKKHLLNPYKVKKRGMDSSKVFERAISWLLSHFGINVIKLDEYEKLREETTGVELGSIDLLACDKNKNLLLLINCTIGIPDEKDIDSLNYVKSLVYDKLFKDTQIKIFPVFFSPKEVNAMKEKSEKYGIKIFDAHDIEKLLNAVKAGGLDEIFKYFR